MDLHISGPKPQWEDVPIEDRNLHQRIADATNGWGTIANALAIAKIGLNASACLDIHNSKGKKLVKPLIKFTAEGLLDVADGWIAKKTQTMSPKGKLIDAGTDKVNTLLAATAAAKYNVLPKDVAIPIILSQGAVAIGGVMSYLTGKENRIQATREGKAVMRDGKIAAGLDILSKTFELNNMDQLSKIAKLGSGVLYRFSVSNVPKVAYNYSNRLFEDSDL